MTVENKVLGQSAPAAATLTTLYDTPAATEVIVSSITICNRSAVATTFRIAVRVADGTIADEDYIYYDQPIPGNETFIATIGVTLGATDAVDVYATLATVSFNLFGQEITA
jgi:hypothetical protein